MPANYPPSLTTKGKIVIVEDLKLRDTIFGKLTCNSRTFTYVKGGYDLSEDIEYEMKFCHLIVPEYFEEVEKGKDQNNFFAIDIREVGGTAMTKVTSSDDESLLEKRGYGFEECAFPIANYQKKITNRPQNQDTDITLEPINLDNIFFHFHKHILTPIVFSNGMTCYYAFESENIMKKWKEKLQDASNKFVQVNSKPFYDNLLGIMIVKDVKLPTNTPDNYMIVPQP